MKDTYYFSHDYNSRNDQKILVLRAKYQARGFGVYWMLIEIMAESTLPHIAHQHVPAIAVGINEPSDWLNEFIEFCINDAKLFVSDGLVFTSMRITEHKKMRELCSESGRIGANKRWGNSPPNSPPNGDPNAKERKGKESKTKPMFEVFYSKYPRKQGKELAFRSFNRICPSDELFKKILDALAVQSKSEQWTKDGGKYIPLPATWLNGKRWEDALENRKEEWVRP